MSRHTHRTVLNVDIGGGTTKFALVRNGEIVSTCAVAAGGRLVALAADGTLARVEDSARHVARALGMDLRPGMRVDPASLGRLADAFAEIVIAMLRQEAPAGLAKDLLLTEPLAPEPRPHLITFTGGVSEYIYGRESATFGDIAKPLAERIVEAFSSGRVPVKMTEPGQGIRATVIGASQFTVQLSGNTIHLSDAIRLPLRNVPVAFPHLALERDFDAAAVAAAIRAAVERIDAEAGLPVALGIRWHGDPHHHRLRGLAEGIVQTLGASGPEPIVLMVDGDFGRLLGRILRDELGVARGVVSIDGIKLRELDYVDIGEVIKPSNVVPVVIKSLLFAPASASRTPAAW
jgi:ethanolamine utilization protein EutA